MQDDPKEKMEHMHSLIAQLKADQAVKASLITSLEA